MSTVCTELSGEWIGFYAGHCDEVIKIVQRGPIVEAIKITGNEYVPEGAVTWRANIETGEGEGQVAEQEYRNSRFIPGHLTVLSDERIVFSWQQYGQVEYRKDE